MLKLHRRGRARLPLGPPAAQPSPAHFPPASFPRDTRTHTQRSGGCSRNPSYRLRQHLAPHCRRERRGAGRPCPWGARGSLGPRGLLGSELLAASPPAPLAPGSPPGQAGSTKARSPGACSAPRGVWGAPCPAAPSLRCPRAGQSPGGANFSTTPAPSLQAQPQGRAGPGRAGAAAGTMPQLPGGGGGGGDPELCATDEMIPFKDEGDPQKEKIFAEISHPEEEGDLADIKSSLVHESEIIPSGAGHEVSRQAQAQESYHDKSRELPEEGKHPDSSLYSKGPSYSGYSGYIMMPNMNNDPYMSNGSLSPPIPRTSNKVPVVQPSHAVHPLTPLITYSDEHFSPGSHPSHIPSDVNSKQGMSRHPPAPDIPTFYPLSPGGVGQITPPLGWQGQPVYPISSGFRQPYPSSLSVDPSMSRFSHHMIPGPPGPHTTGIPHPAIVTPQVKQEHPHNDSELMHVKPQHEQRKEQEPKRPHIKKPLNAFMLYMKEMRANVVAECTLKESAAINQILGRRWHALSREEQAKYYELARKERQLHMQLYPGWSARDNYGKKKKRKREKLQESASGGKRNSFSTCKAKAATPGPLLEMEAC